MWRIKPILNNYFMPESVFVYWSLNILSLFIFRTRYEQLREDFQFNLAILDERDGELARYDSLTTKALTVNHRYHSLYSPVCVHWDIYFALFYIII